MWRATCIFPATTRTNIIYRFGADGKLVTLVDDWEQLMLIAPTNIAFGGTDMKTLLIANLCGWNLASARMETAGLPVKYPLFMM
jgi:sugar lactone lactonase YvrE